MTSGMDAKKEAVERVVDQYLDHWRSVGHMLEASHCAIREIKGFTLM